MNGLSLLIDDHLVEEEELRSSKRETLAVDRGGCAYKSNACNPCDDLLIKN